MKNAFEGQGRAEGSRVLISSVDARIADDKRENDCENT